MNHVNVHLRNMAPPQYDAIGEKYNNLKALPTSIILYENFRDTLLPLLSRRDEKGDLHKPLRVLDLACGAGYHTKNALDWGADYVLGVDISPVMIKTAEKQLLSLGLPRENYEFRVGDARELGKVWTEETGPFDIVTGAWLLNYAANLDEVTKMFRTISSNLIEGGKFVGVLPYPAENVDAHVNKRVEKQRLHPEAFVFLHNFVERLETDEGWKLDVVLNGDCQNGRTKAEDAIRLETYMLRKSIYEEGARLGGLEGSLEWRDLNISETARKVVGEERLRLSEQYGMPHCQILVVGKSH